MKRALVYIQVAIVMLQLSCSNHSCITDNEQLGNLASFIDTTATYQYPSYLVGEYQKTLADIRVSSTPESAIILFATDLHYSYLGSDYYEYELMNGINNMFHTIQRMSLDLSPDLASMVATMCSCPCRKKD